MHDILTGSNPDGTASGESCGDWTMGGADGAATVGHSDRTGLDDSAAGEVVERLARDPRRLQPRGLRRAPAAPASSTASPPTEPLALWPPAASFRRPAHVMRDLPLRPPGGRLAQARNQPINHRAGGRPCTRSRSSLCSSPSWPAAAPAPRWRRANHRWPAPRRAPSPRASPPGARASGRRRSRPASAPRSSTPPSRASGSTPTSSASTASRPSSPSRSGSISTAPPRRPGSRPAAPSGRGLNDTLAAIEARYGVDRQAVLAIWGMESNYGKNRGSIPVVESLATLAYDGRRQSFAEEQLIAALRILQSGDVTPVGTWSAPGPAPWATPSSSRRPTSPMPSTSAATATATSGPTTRPTRSPRPPTTCAAPAGPSASPGASRCGCPTASTTAAPTSRTSARSPTGAPAA